MQRKRSNTGATASAASASPSRRRSTATRHRPCRGARLRIGSLEGLLLAVSKTTLATKSQLRDVVEIYKKKLEDLYTESGQLYKARSRLYRITESEIRIPPSFFRKFSPEKELRTLHMKTYEDNKRSLDFEFRRRNESRENNTKYVQ